MMRRASSYLLQRPSNGEHQACPVVTIQFVELLEFQEMVNAHKLREVIRTIK